MIAPSRRDEAFVAIRGEAQVELGGERFALRAGDGLSVPPHTAFSSGFGSPRQLLRNAAEPR